MAKIMFTWEWGAGAGHLRLFAPIATHLVECGHDVTIVSRDVGRTLDLFPHERIRCLPCPVHVSHQQPGIRHPISIAQLAWNLGFRDENGLAALLRVWRDLLTLTKPEILISDFGLASIAVANSFGIPTIRIGNGYLCPPCHDPPPIFDGVLEQAKNAERMSEAHAFSARMLSSINRCLSQIGLPSEQDWRQLLIEPDRTILLTIPPLDPYRNQRETAANYVGFWDRCGGKAPEWPEFGNSRALAYLKPFRALPRLLTELTAVDVATALVPDGIPANQIPQVVSQYVRQQSGMVDLSLLGDQCRFAICNANHGMICRVLSLGIPVLSVPVFLEHRLTAMAIERAGCGITVQPTNPAAFRTAIDRLLHDPSFATAAERFSVTYGQYRDGALERAITRIDALILS